MSLNGPIIISLDLESCSKSNFTFKGFSRYFGARVREFCTGQLQQWHMRGWCQREDRSIFTRWHDTLDFYTWGGVEKNFLYKKFCRCHCWNKLAKNQFWRERRAFTFFRLVLSNFGFFVTGSRPSSMRDRISRTDFGVGLVVYRLRGLVIGLRRVVDRFETEEMVELLDLTPMLSGESFIGLSGVPALMVDRFKLNWAIARLLTVARLLTRDGVW